MEEETLPADLHLLQAEDVNSSLLPPVDQVFTGGLHENDVFHSVLRVLYTVQYQVDFIYHVTHYGRDGSCGSDIQRRQIRHRHINSEVGALVPLLLWFTFVYDVADGFCSQRVVQRD